MNKIDLKNTSSFKEAGEEIERLDRLFIEKFGKNTKCEMFIFLLGDVKLGTQRQGVALYWDKKHDKEADFFKQQVQYTTTYNKST